MSASVIPLNSEIDTLNDIEDITKITFQHCRDMIKDIMTYSQDSSGDLMRLKMRLSTLSELQKETAGLIYATNRIYNLTDRVNLTEEEAVTKFQETFDEYIEETDIDDNQKNLLSSLDNFLNEKQAPGAQKEDSELLVTKTTLIYKDPLTQRTMQDPVKSKICNHSYERESIITYLADTKKPCPYSGCQNKLSRRDLVDDFVLKLKLSVKEEGSS